MLKLTKIDVKVKFSPPYSTVQKLDTKLDV